MIRKVSLLQITAQDMLHKLRLNESFLPLVSLANLMFIKPEIRDVKNQEEIKIELLIYLVVSR